MPAPRRATSCCTSTRHFSSLNWWRSRASVGDRTSYRTDVRGLEAVRCRARHIMILATLALLILATSADARYAMQMDGCVYSCRWRAARRLPSWHPPLRLISCSLPKALSPRCAARNHTMASAAATNATTPRIVVAMTTCPGRANSVFGAVSSLLRNTRQPERILVSAANKFERWGGGENVTDALKLLKHFAPRPSTQASTLLEISVHRAVGLPPNPAPVETILCDKDLGPGTKLLCALPRLRELDAANRTNGGPLYVALGMPHAHAISSSSDSMLHQYLLSATHTTHYLSHSLSV